MTITREMLSKAYHQTWKSDNFYLLNSNSAIREFTLINIMFFLSSYIITIVINLHSTKGCPQFSLVFFF
jgi:hypothetical protein